MGIGIVSCMIALILLWFVVLMVRAVLCRIQGRGLTQKQTIATPDEEYYYASRLTNMIACKTISRKNQFEAEEFLKLREVLARLFPMVSKSAEIRFFGDDCYVYKLAGMHSDKNVMVMSHHDVVDVQGDWRYPPFSGQIAENCIWGRGTIDTKTPLFAEFSALEELLSEGWKPACNVYLVSSHNEEIAGNGVPLVLQWLQEQKITFDWILDEGGAVIDAPMSGIHCKCAMLAVHEKGRYTIRIKASEQSGHGSLAAQVTSPAVRMAEFITQIEKKQPFLRTMHPEVLAMFGALAPYMTFPMRLIFANMWCFQGILKRLIPSLNAQAGSMLGTTCTFKNLQTAANGDCTAEVFFRCVKEEDLKQDIQMFREIAEQRQIEITEVLEDEYHRPAKLNSQGYQYIKECVERNFGYAACAPFILPAGTDARHFSDLSSAVIRFAPIDINQQQYASVHNIDENISIEAVVRAVKFYKDVLRSV